ncbi:hypothetical protein MMC13_001968 [Lambiella insularis]|nr:hypothetical protein [Lambiella insularis]
MHPSDPELVGRAQSFIDLAAHNPDYHGHDAWLGPNTHITAASSPPTTPYTTVVTRLTIPRHFCNLLGNLHGGATATILDVLTSLPLSLVPNWELSGVSRSLTVAFLRPAKEGEEMEIKAEVMAAGKQLASTRGIMTRVRDGAVVATCQHEKVNVGPREML